MMVYYTVSEAAKELEVSSKTVYEYVKEIEATTPHQFGRMFRGHYFLGNPRKEKVISARDLQLLGQLLDFIEIDKVKPAEAIHELFAPI